MSAARQKFEEHADWLRGKFSEIGSAEEQDYSWGFLAEDRLFRFRVLYDECRIEIGIKRYFDRWATSRDFVHYRLPVNERQWFKFRNALLEAYDAGRYDSGWGQKLEI